MKPKRLAEPEGATAPPPVFYPYGNPPEKPTDTSYATLGDDNWPGWVYWVVLWATIEMCWAIFLAYGGKV